MTKRQEWLIELLRRSKGVWLSESDIIEAMIDDIVLKKFDDRDAYVYHENAKGSKCMAIWGDADKINQDIECPAIILMKDRQFAIAMSERGVHEMLLAPLMKKASSSFARFWNIKRKLSLQNQGRLKLSSTEVQFMELFARPYESLLDNMGEENKDGCKEA